MKSFLLKIGLLSAVLSAHGISFGMLQQPKENSPKKQNVTLRQQSGSQTLSLRNTTFSQPEPLMISDENAFYTQLLPNQFVTLPKELRCGKNGIFTFVNKDDIKNISRTCRSLNQLLIHETHIDTSCLGCNEKSVDIIFCPSLILYAVHRSINHSFIRPDSLSRRNHLRINPGCTDPVDARMYNNNFQYPCDEKNCINNNQQNCTIQ